MIKPTVGRARRTSSATSPMRFAPISITALRCEASRRISVSGTPMWLLRLPWVAMHGPRRDRIAAVISLVGGLAVAAAHRHDGDRKSARQACASCCSARSASATTICGSATAGTARSTMAPTAPRAARAGDEIRAVEFRSAQRDEQRPRHQRAAVGRHRRNRAGPRRSAVPPSVCAASLQGALHAAAPKIAAPRADR